jgi:16S rRNA (guanine966-N2)-methyltransferase
VREAVFDVLLALPEVRAGTYGVPDGGPLAGHVCLDLFAGSGGLGIEALSRGASACTFIERDRAALRALHTNLERLGLGTAGSNGRSRSPSWRESRRARVVGADVHKALRADALQGSLYTLIFADPPYDAYAELQSALTSLLGPLMAPGAVLVVETDARTSVEMPWRVVRVKIYGDTKVTFLVADEPGQPEEAGGEGSEEI